MNTGEKGYLKKAICFIMYICKKGGLLPPSLMSSGRGVSKKIAKFLKIHIVMGNPKFKNYLSEFSASLMRCITLKIP